jgi:hypothetical protein
MPARVANYGCQEAYSLKLKAIVASRFDRLNFNRSAATTMAF